MTMSVQNSGYKNHFTFLCIYFTPCQETIQVACIKVLPPPSGGVEIIEQFVFRPQQTVVSAFVQRTNRVRLEYYGEFFFCPLDRYFSWCCCYCPNAFSLRYLIVIFFLFIIVVFSCSNQQEFSL